MAGHSEARVRLTIIGGYLGSGKTTWLRHQLHAGRFKDAFVIVNEASAHAVNPFASKVLEQADVMRSQVAHHLERARIAARVSIVSTVTDVGPAIDRPTRPMS